MMDSLLRGRNETITRIVMIALSMAALMPWLPEMPNSTLDGSWAFAMNEAVARHFVIGQDVIFTFGPYAPVFTHLYHPALFALTLAATGYLACLYIVCLLTLTANIRIAHLAAVCVLFVSCYRAPDALLYSYPLMVGLIVISDAVPATRLITKTTGLALLFSGFGLLVLVKGSLIPLCLAVMGLSAISLTSRREIKSLIIGSLGSLVAMMFFWTWAGQPLTGLPTYFRTLAPIISGYSDAMGLLGPRHEVLQYLLGAFAALLVVWRGESDRSTRLMLSALLTVFLFLAFKGGMVRHDGHIVLVSAAALLLGAALISARFPSPYSIAVVISGAAILVHTNIFWGALPETNASLIYTPYRNMFVALTKDMTEQGWREQLFLNATARIRKEVPVAIDVADTYPLNQAAVIVAGGPWKPRPVFQSYSAYTPELLTINRNHLLEPDAPHRIDFAVNPIDGRWPSLDDGASWPLLLTHYRVVEFRDDRLTLERTSDVIDHQTRIFFKRSARLGEKVAVPAVSGSIWARMMIKQSILGKLMTIFFKAPQLEIAARLSNGSEAVYRIVPGMTQTDFLLSPWVTSTQEFGRLYSTDEVPADRRVVSFEIRASGQAFGAWQPEYEIELRSS